ncbi:NlpC/P60 family protein [Brevibacterium litoralis]|uniref:NlpC/P60 family protein n=1 Tax=Brevibacterium litoralis TaxID=3138935 RepID=UPI0032EB6102
MRTKTLPFSAVARRTAAALALAVVAGTGLGTAVHATPDMSGHAADLSGNAKELNEPAPQESQEPRTTWNGHEVTGPVLKYWTAAGGKNGTLGLPTSDLDSSLPEGGSTQSFAGGDVYVTPGGSVYSTIGGIGDRWEKNGGVTGWLGYPTTDESCGLTGGGCYQKFEGGSIHWSPDTGAHATSWKVRTGWSAEGWENGDLGYPTSESWTSAGATVQEFEGGLVVASSHGSFGLMGKIAGSWKWNGSMDGLGAPISAETCGLTRGGCFQKFEDGSIHWSPETGAHATTGVMRDAWRAAGWERGEWGYPTSAQSEAEDGRVKQWFEDGLKYAGEKDEDAIRADILATARSYIGTPYVWGGTSPSGWDCSGMVQYIYAQYGVDLPRNSAAQASAGVQISESEARPGDLVYVPGHIGIVSDRPGYMVDAGSSRSNTSERPYSWMTDQGATFYRVL